MYHKIVSINTCFYFKPQYLKGHLYFPLKSHSKPVKKWGKKCSTGLRFICTEATSYKIHTLDFLTCVKTFSSIEISYNMLSKWSFFRFESKPIIEIVQYQKSFNLKIKMACFLWLIAIVWPFNINICFSQLMLPKTFYYFSG